MASIYRRTRSYPIPSGAEIVTDRKGQRFAKWTDRKTGRTRKEPLNAAGDKVTIESGNYLIAYFDAAGKRQEINSGTPDFETAERIAGQLNRKVALQEFGIIDTMQERFSNEARRAIAEHLDDFKAAMQSAARTAEHVDATIGFVQAITTAAGWQTLADIDADAVNTYAADMLGQGLAARTVQARLTAIKSFTRWLARHGKLAHDPLAAVKKPNPKADRRHERRMMLPEEWDWLRVTTDQGRERYGMTGHERMLLYAVAIQTGLRSSECRSLTRGRLFLDGEQPYVTAKAGSTKNRKDARQYIQTDLAAELQAHITTKAPAAPVFTMPTKYNVARMFRQDLSDARRAWLAAAVDADDRMTREQSDFLGYVNHDGERADFHALRHTCGAWLAMAGNHPKAVQSIMRHSSITLTMDTYGHLFPGAEADAVARLPAMLGDAPQALAATGTDGKAGNLPANRQQYGSETSTIVAGSCEPSDDDQRRDGQQNVLTFNDLSGTRQEAAELGGSEVAGARTQGLRIKSPLLYRLSYNLKLRFSLGFLVFSGLSRCWRLSI